MAVNLERVVRKRRKNIPQLQGRAKLQIRGGGPFVDSAQNPQKKN